MKKFAADYGKPVARLLGYRSLTNAFFHVSPRAAAGHLVEVFQDDRAEVRGLLRCCRA